MTKKIFGYILLVVFLFLAYYSKHPHFLKIREYELFILPAISLILILFYKNKKEYSFVFGYSLVIAIVLFLQIRLTYYKHRIIAGEGERVRELAKHIIIGYDNPYLIKTFIGLELITGVYITHRNIKGKSIDEIKTLLDSFQKVRKKTTLIATDFEGGIVSRLSPPLTKLPPLSSLDLKDENQIKKYATTHAKELSYIGINLNFAPVVDLKINSEKLIDLHSLIDKRAISSDPKVVSKVAQIYAKTMQEYNILSTLKHFPGLGEVTSDTHHFSAVLDTDIELLEKREWIPFKNILKNSNSLLMLSHTTLTKIDKNNPVSTSKKVIQDIIRGKWKHDGILITDDLSMGAISNSKRGICGSGVDALNAGVDILLISYDHEKYYRIMSCLLDAYRSGELDLEMLKKSEKRIFNTLN